MFFGRVLMAIACCTAVAGCGQEAEGQGGQLVVTSAQDSCATRAGAYAQCPRGRHLTSGGYRLMSWDLRAIGGSVEPTVNEAEGDSWHVMGHGPVGNACFTAYAICGG